MNMHPSFARQQRGVALIVTLVILVVVTFMGLIAMRAGLLQVAMSTNSQVNVLLFQSADAGVSTIEKTINDNVLAATVGNGPLVVVGDNPGSEIVGCLIKTGSGIRQGTTVATASSPERCDAGAVTDRISGRDVVIVQTSLKTPGIAGAGSSPPPKGADFSGTEADLVPGTGDLPEYLLVFATSVMPNYGSATSAEINECLKKPQDDEWDPAGIETVTDCLTTANASFHTAVQEYAFGRASGYR